MMDSDKYFKPNERVEIFNTNSHFDGVRCNVVGVASMGDTPADDRYIIEFDEAELIKLGMGKWKCGTMVKSYLRRV